MSELLPHYPGLLTAGMLLPRQCLITIFDRVIVFQFLF